MRMVVDRNYLRTKEALRLARVFTEKYIVVLTDQAEMEMEEAETGIGSAQSRPRTR